ncbi:facilitated trehalose transporter Tret1-like [Cydia fagiglandana]|uniref:facilitated trehalose transporter Tret1-like n=1 Tax=Cydia fagiglandana TaxID=1458189 RepID=UPI002FEE40B5
MQQYLRKQLVIAGIIYIGQMLVGFGMGWTAPVLPKLQDPEQSPISTEITPALSSWIGSLLYIGCIIGPYITGYFSNIIGRKPCLLIGGVVTAFSFILVIFTGNLTMIFAVRIIKGFGIGIIAVGNIVYIGEIASKNIRGILLTATGIAGTLGTLIIFSVGPYVSYKGTGWLGLGLTLMFVGSVLLIPESPMFPVIKDREDEAKRILIELGRHDEIEEFLASKIEKTEQRNVAEWKELFSIRSNRRALFMLLTLNIFQQMSGIVAMLFFTTSIFELAGSSVTPHIATIIIGVTQLGSSCFTPLFVEWSGRKTLLLLSTAVCGMSLAVLGTYFYFAERGYAVDETVGWLPLLTLIVFFMFYDFGFGIIPGTLTGEMFRSNVRSTGAAVTSTTAWLVGFVVSSVFGYMMAVGMHFIFWMFAASCLCACLFTVFCVPETKGKSLIEIQEMLE